MNFELTKTYLDELVTALRARDSHLSTRLAKLHPADIAEIMDELDMDDARVLYGLLDEAQASEVLVELEEDIREKLLEALSSRQIAETVIENLDSDDAADVIAELPAERKGEVISYIEDQQQAQDITDLLAYGEDTAGALMAKELISVEQDWTVLRCVREMRKQAEQVDQVYAVYVTDKNKKLIGVLPVKNLLLVPARQSIEGAYDRDVVSVEANTDAEEVARLMDKYNLVVLPVVNANKELVGRITIDDVVDFIREEAKEDYQMASGISEDVESSDSVWLLTRARLPWLLIGLLGGILGARVIGFYEEDIHLYPEMAFFIPLIAAMGGNVGVQSSAIIVQGLATKSLGMEGIVKKLWKEFTVALLNGTALSLLIFGYNLIFSDSLSLSVTVSFSLLIVIIFAGLFGTFVPLVLDKYKIDPALATGPFITTMNDIIGLLIYFIIGGLMYELL